MLVYLDTCAVQRPTDDRTQLRVRVEAEAVLAIVAAVRAGGVRLLASEVLFFEVDNQPAPERLEVARAILSLAERTVEPSDEVIVLAVSYESAGIRPLDALHPASAVHGESDAFCTTDDALLRRAQTLDTRQTRVLTPLHLIAILDP